jgi:RNA polymerase sigma-70 factor (ECF subfamily)
MEVHSASETWTGLAELRPVVSRFLARRCRDDSEAEDIVQEALLRAFRYRGGLSNPARLRPWLLRIALNLLRDHVRRERRLPCIDVDPDLFERIEGREGVPGESREDLHVQLDGAVVEKPRALVHLCDAKEELRTRDRTVLDSHYEAGRSCRETAFVCEIPPCLVKVRLFRARKRLQRVLRSRLSMDLDPPPERFAMFGGARFPRIDRGATCAAACQTTDGGAGCVAEEDDEDFDEGPGDRRVGPFPAPDDIGRGLGSPCGSGCAHEPARQQSGGGPAARERIGPARARSVAAIGHAREGGR